MFRAIIFQIWAVVITAGLLGMFVGGHGAASAAVGGGACLLPNALFALRLAVAARRPGGPGVAGFFLGEFVKVAATIGILAVAAKVYPEMHWPSMLLGLVVTLQASFWLFGRNPEMENAHEAVAEHAANAPTAGEYIVHHLTHFNSTGHAQSAVVDFSVINVDTVVFSILMGILGLFVMWRVAKSVTSGVPGRMQAAVEIVLEMVNNQAKGIVHSEESRKFVAPWL